jgi:hypothetical protein
MNERERETDLACMQMDQDMIGFNRAALRYIQREVDQRSEGKTFDRVANKLMQLKEAQGKKLPKAKRQRLKHTEDDNE